MVSRCTLRPRPRSLFYVLLFVFGFFFFFVFCCDFFYFYFFNFLFYFLFFVFFFCFPKARKNKLITSAVARSPLPIRLELIPVREIKVKPNTSHRTRSIGQLVQLKTVDAPNDSNVDHQRWASGSHVQLRPRFGGIIISRKPSCCPPVF